MVEVHTALVFRGPVLILQTNESPKIDPVPQDAFERSSGMSEALTLRPAFAGQQSAEKAPVGKRTSG